MQRAYPSAPPTTPVLESVPPIGTRMRRDELAYDLPPERIAQFPVEPRDASRLLVLHRRSGVIEHRRFRDLPEYLRSGDALVLNDTRVVPARFFARRSSGGVVEALFLGQTADALYVLLRPGRRIRVGQTLAILDREQRHEAGVALRVVARGERGQWSCALEPPMPVLDLLERVGHPPLPPYIRQGRDVPEDARRYQTVYARQPGSIAAPTAGLHFTPALLERIASAGVHRLAVTLHVGLGTFAPVEVDDLSQHPMHAEWFTVSGATLGELDAVRRAGGRIVAVGTTSARVLEALAEPAPAAPAGSDAADARTGAAGRNCAIGTDETARTESANRRGAARSGGEANAAIGRAHGAAGLECPAMAELGESGVSGWTRLFIYPPYAFRNVDALVTNFHLPASTLLALTMAFGGVEAVRRAYRQAVRDGYRFYSYGDAMLLL